MTRKRLSLKRLYTYSPVLIDLADPPHGVKAGLIKPGDKVRVVKLPGCPAPGTMGHAHIQTEGGVFAGLVAVNSLQ